MSDASRWCATCNAWTQHHTDRHHLHVCSCGNLFGGDNLCMVSACQWEGTTESPAVDNAGSR